MAIAPSKLGRLISDEWKSEDTLVRKLRAAGLVKRGVSDAQLKETLRRAREEHEQIHENDRLFNSPNERVRVFLHPYLTWKGRRWAIPIASLEPPWWRFWIGKDRL
jgi:hypothetical protein